MTYCCEEFEKNTGTKNVGFEKCDDKWYVNGCCGGGCFVLSNIKHCPFCGAELNDDKVLEDLAIGGGICSAVGTINGVPVDENDFGTLYDHCPADAPEHGCGDMRFDAIPCTDEVLNKYSITKNQYHKICDALTEGLNFGWCAKCS